MRPFADSVLQRFTRRRNGQPLYLRSVPGSTKPARRAYRQYKDVLNGAGQTNIEDVLCPEAVFQHRKRYNRQQPPIGIHLHDRGVCRKTEHSLMQAGCYLLQKAKNEEQKDGSLPNYTPPP